MESGQETKGGSSVYIDISCCFPGSKLFNNTETQVITLFVANFQYVMTGCGLFKKHTC